MIMPRTEEAGSYDVASGIALYPEAVSFDKESQMRPTGGYTLARGLRTILASLCELTENLQQGTINAAEAASYDRQPEGDTLPTEGFVPANRSGDGGGKAIKIMVVEDEFLTALNTKEYLLLSGYEVPAVATSGEEAIRMAAEIQPDLILMDIILDGAMNGIEAANEIQKTRRTPIVYLSAYANSSMINKAKETRPFAYLTKPCTMTTLRSTIEVTLHKNSLDTEEQKLADQKFENALARKSVQIEETNTALKVLLEQMNRERHELQQNIQANLTRLIQPTLQTLENSKLSESQRILVESIRINLQLLTEAHVSPFGEKITQLSKTEMQVANFIKAGKSTKEICQFLDIAASTINTHRDSIRKKMGIKNTKTNLRKALQEML